MIFLGGFLVALSTILLSLSSDNNNKSSPSYNFKDLSLQIAVENYEEGDQFFSDGKYLEACNSYMDGILVGRRSVQQLIESKNQQQQGNDDLVDDDPDLALDWLVSSYIKSSNGRIKLNDWETARADAWAACSYSQNTNLFALQLMLSICEKTKDKLGQLQTLKLILDVVVVSGSIVVDDDGDVAGGAAEETTTTSKSPLSSKSNNDDDNVTGILSYSIKDLEKKIDDLDDELMRKMRG